MAELSNSRRCPSLRRGYLFTCAGSGGSLVSWTYVPELSGVNRLHLINIESGHWPMIIKPRELAEIFAAVDTLPDQVDRGDRGGRASSPSWEGQWPRRDWLGAHASLTPAS